MLAQILHRQFAPELVQRMLRVCNGDEPNPHQRVAGKAGWYLRADRQIYLALNQRFLSATEHGLVELDSNLRLLLREAPETLEQQPGGEDDLYRQAQLRFPARRQSDRRPPQSAGFLQ